MDGAEHAESSDQQVWCLHLAIGDGEPLRFYKVTGTKLTYLVTVEHSKRLHCRDAGPRQHTSRFLLRA